MNVNNNTAARKVWQRTVLSASLCVLMQPMVMQTSFALESISEKDMRGVSGQDGIHITAEMDNASIDKLTWQDGTAGSVVLSGERDATGKITNPMTVTNTGGTVKTDIKVQTGSNAAGDPAMKLDIGLGKAVIDVPKLSVCDASGANCTDFGALAVTNAGTQTSFSLVTSKGLFNEQGTAQLKAVLDNLTVALKQKNGTPEATNQLMLGEMYANITADGKLFVTDTEGLKFIGTVNFEKKTFGSTQREGLELLVQHKAGTATAKTLGKIALTGSMTDVDLSVRGVKDNAAITDLGFKNGTNGIAMRMSANFDENMTLQLGGHDGDGMRLTGWKTLGGTGTKSFDTGNVYINVVPADATVNQTLKTNDRLVTDSAVITAAQNQATYLTRNFKKEQGDNNTTPFGTTGTQYISKGGYVVDSSGNVINELHGLRLNYNKGIVNKYGQHLSVKDFLKDGYVTNGTVETFNGTSSWGNHSYGGTFEQISRVSGASVLPYSTTVYDSTNGSNNRGSRQIYVWKTMVDENGATQAYPAGYNGNIVVASFENGGGADEWFKAVNLANGNRASDNNLTNLNFPFTINDNGEVRNGSGVLLMDAHTINTLGFLVQNSSGSANTNNNGSSTGNGAYVYEYEYELDAATNQLKVKKAGTNTVVKTIQLQVFSADAFQKTTAADYSITTDTASGDGGTTKAGQSISLNVRDMNLQGYATKTQFFDASNTDTQNWAIAPVLYDVNANILLFPKTLNAANAVANYTQAGEAIGYKAVATTTGSDKATDFHHTGATKTTGLLLTHADATDNTKTRYVGLRHVDSLIKAQGDIQITGEGIALTAKDFLFAFRGELAAGKMPESGGTFGVTDKLFIAEGKIKGDLYAKMFAASEGLGFDATLKLAQNPAFGTNSGVRLIGPSGQGSLNLGEITGTLNAKGTLDTKNRAASGAGVYDGAVSANMTLTLNPDNDPKQDVRVRNIGFNAKNITSGSGSTVYTGSFDPYQDQRLGEIAFTKNTIYSEVTIGD